MKEICSNKLETVTGGSAALAFTLLTGYLGSFNELTEFGSGLGAGIYDALHKKH
ncbi:hypothetical protein PN836_000430 [Ningiella sp. W23]|uniref:hypothetical protein n=1 Tax=Ningiella sp. W23 TaxID=3023715 RepID=UPI00375726AC